MKYLVVDLETRGKTTYKRFCNPLDQRHTVILCAMKFNKENPVVMCNPKDYKEGLDRNDMFGNLLDDVDILVGQNIKFDLLWFWQSPKFQQWLKGGGKVWDTMTLQYLLDGQAREPRDLNSLAAKYGGSQKNDAVGVMLNQGIDICDIDPVMLIDYAKEDVINTEKVMLAQYKLLQKDNMLPLAVTYMEHYLAICEMEYNGLYVDKVRLEEMQHKQEGIIKGLEDKIKQIVGDDDFNPMSNQQVSKFLFGTIRSVDEKTLSGYTGEHTTFTQAILELRGANKLLKTYLYRELLYKRANKVKGIKAGDIRSATGLKPLIMNDKTIHSEFKTAYTQTGRLSSKNPNVQNLPPEILDIFTSRWGDDGVVLEADFSQLEVCVQAYLTQSKKMIEDITVRVDFHCLRLSYAENLPYSTIVENCASDPDWKKKRSKAKVISFQKAYGAQPRKIAESSGLDEATVLRVFQKEDERYPEIKQYYETVLDEVEQSRTPKTSLLGIFCKKTQKKIERDGVYESVGRYQSVTGKKYSFQQKAVLTKQGRVFQYWSIPDIQNYPVQGTAADIVALQVGALFRDLIHHRDKCLIINEVHDSIILDVKKEHLEWIKSRVCAIMSNVDKMFMKRFKINFNVPIRIDISTGKSWGKCK
jgi:DNA polymerase I-like protein with 3'-5' exonuclease and polymerase domains